MQIATLSSQPRRRAPRFPVPAAARPLRVLIDVTSATERERLLAALRGHALASSLELVSDGGSDLGRGAPYVQVSASSGLDSELELCATTGGSESASALVFEIVQALAQASFGVHVTFSETSPARRPSASRRALP